jgi:hypothetical protein
MGANNYNNAVKIAKQCMMWLDNNTVMPQLVNTEYKEEYRDSGAKGGDTFNVRVPVAGGQIAHGAAATPDSYQDTYVPITLAQHNISMNFTTKELLMNVEDGEGAFMRNVLGPKISALASYIDQGAFDLYEHISQMTGVPGTLPTSTNPFLEANAYLDDAAVPRDGQRVAVVSPWSQASIVNGNRTLFHASNELEKEFTSGEMGIAAGLKFYMDQNVKNHTCGDFTTATPHVDGATVDGATSVQTNDWASGATNLKAGDIISFENVYAVNPITKATSRQLKQFCVAAAISDTSGSILIALTEPLTLTGNYQNINALPVNDAAVYFFGAHANTYSGKVSNTDLVFHRDAFGLMFLDLPVPESAVFAKRVKSKKTNMAIRLVQFYNGMTDQELYRLDVLFGWALYRPHFAARVQG